MQRIQDEPQLRQLLSQFVMLRLNVDGTAHSEWSKLYPHEGNTLPIVYVIRADRLGMFAKSTVLPGDEFPLMLLEKLTQAGSRLDDREVRLLDEATGIGKQAVVNGDDLELVRATKKARKLVRDKSPCYARAAVEFEGVFLPMVEAGRTGIAALKELAAAPTTPEQIAQHVMTYAAAAHRLEQLDLLASELKEADRAFQASKAIRAALIDARKVVAATQAKKLSESQRAALVEIQGRQANNVIGQRAAELLTESEQD